MSKPLTKTQRSYLDTIVTRGRLVQGWGGMGSTRTVRILEERGYIRLQTFGRSEWRATPLDKGRDEMRETK